MEQYKENATQLHDNCEYLLSIRRYDDEAIHVNAFSK